MDTLNVTAAATEDQVNAWKEEFGKLKIVGVDGKLIYFRQPGRDLVNQATAAMIRAKGDVGKYNNIILRNCQLNYIQETKDDDELYFALTSQVDNIVTSKVAELKNE